MRNNKREEFLAAVADVVRTSLKMAEFHKLTAAEVARQVAFSVLVQLDNEAVATVGNLVLTADGVKINGELHEWFNEAMKGGAA